jgi:hypothetical protein
MSEGLKAMKVFGRGIRLAMGVVVLGLAGPALAQENLDSGKTPAQLYASDCAVCHKTPQGLAAKGGGLLGLENFLREHYTASRESAAAIAGYLRGVGGAPAAAPAGRAGKRPPKGEEKAKTGEKTDEKTGEKASEKTGEKATEKKPVAAKPDAKSAGGKGGAEGKSSEPKAAEPKTAEPKPADSGKQD